MFFGMLAYSLIPLTVVLALVVLSIRAIVLAVVTPRRCVKEASCEKCRYPVAGLTTLQCPECGSNLLRVGIITRSMEIRRRGGYFSAITGLGFLIAMVVIIAEIILATYMDPFTGMVMGGATTTQTFTTTLTPNSGAYKSLDVETTYDFSLGANTNTTILKLQANNGSLHRLRTVAGFGKYELLDPTYTVIATGPMDEKAIDALYNAAGVQTAATSLERAQAFRVADYCTIQFGAQVGQMNVKGFTVGPTNFAAPAAGATAATQPGMSRYSVLAWSFVAIGFILWLLGAWLIIRRRIRLLADPESTSPPREAALATALERAPRAP